MRAHAKRALALCGLALFPVTSMADWTMNMSPGVTQTSNDIYGLHMTILWICVVIGVVVFGVMFWSIFAHRKSRGHKPAPQWKYFGPLFLWLFLWLWRFRPPSR